MNKEAVLSIKFAHSLTGGRNRSTIQNITKLSAVLMGLTALKGTGNVLITMKVTN
jgi:hypothetical protein